MKLQLGKLGALGAVALSLISATSCAEVKTDLFIRGVAPIKASGTSCSFATDTNLLSGIMDVNLVSQFRIGVHVGSQLLAAGKAEQLRPESNRILITGAEVHLLDEQGRLIEEFTVVATGFVDPTKTSEASYGIAAFRVIPPQTGALLRDQFINANPGRINIIATFSVFGETLGGAEIESGEYSWPITICYGCQVYFPSEAMIQDSTGRRYCGGEGESGDPPACDAGTGSAVDCRTCRDIAYDEALCLYSR